MEKENVRERAAQIYAAIIGDWSIEATFERSLEMAVDAAILFESRVDAEIDSKMDSIISEIGITAGLKLPAVVRAKQDVTYFCGHNLAPVKFAKGFIATIWAINHKNKSLLFDTGSQTDWFPTELIDKDFELCEPQS